MFPGLPRNRKNCRVVPILAARTSIALKGDDPDFVFLELASGASFGGVLPQVSLPVSAPIGKSFTFIFTMDPRNFASLDNEIIQINIPAVTGGVGTTDWRLCAGQEARFIYGPRGWITPRGTLSGQSGASEAARFATGVAFGYGADAGHEGVGIGGGAAGYSRGVGVGNGAAGVTDGVAIGRAATGSTSGVAVGYTAFANSNGVAIGYQASTNNLDKAVAIGYYSKAERYRELVKSADGASTCLNSFSVLDWYGSTANATPAEILLGGTAAKYALLLNSSAFLFKLLAVARDNVNNDCAMWELTGGIKRGANAAATAIVGTVTKTVIAADAAATTGLWDIGATADTTNGSLKLTVTGEAAKTIRWNVRGDISELRF
jgi:hypothetical protein